MKFAIRKIFAVQRIASASGGTFFNSKIYPVKCEVLLAILYYSNILNAYKLQPHLCTCLMIRSGTLQCIQLQIENKFCRLQLDNRLFILPQIQNICFFPSSYSSPDPILSLKSANQVERRLGIKRLTRTYNVPRNRISTRLNQKKGQKADYS